MRTKRMKPTCVRRVAACLLAFAMLFSGITIPGSVHAAQAESETIAAWAYTAAPENATLTQEAPLGATDGSGALYVEKVAYTGYSSKSLSAKSWQDGGAWVMHVNAADYEALTFSTSMRSSGTGPKTFALEYSTDQGANWQQIEESEISNTTTLAARYTDFSLPEDVSGKDFLLSIRAQGTGSVNDSTVSASGTSNINNISIKGVKKSGESGDTSEKKVVCENVTASPASGEVEKGTKVTLSCSTTGADIYYALNGAETYEKYESTIELTEATTIQAYASKEGCENSETEMFQYTIKQQEESGSDATVDTSKVFTVAQIAGNADYESAGVEQTKTIPGDLYETNDMLDGAMEYTAVVNGQKILPYKKSTSSTTGSTSFYMGGDGLGSGNDDYIQMKLSSAGYGAMAMSFRMRASNTAAGSFQLQYSTDGTNFSNFTTGTYSYQYTAYVGGEPSEKSGSGNITDGVAKTSYAPGNYINFTFDIPQGADQADTLYIRMIPGKEKANGNGTPTTAGAVRVDSVVITGSPVTASNICDYVSVTPESGEVSKNTELTFSTATEGAEIYYSLNQGAYKKYNADAKPVITELPATVRTYAAKAGRKDSIKTIYSYTSGKVKSVTAAPNGGAVVAGTKVTLKCATEGATIYYSENQTDWKEYTDSITLSTLPVTYYVKAVKNGFEDSSITTLSFTEKTTEKYGLYFGQLHSHTNYSDGAGSCEDAYKHATAVENLDYLAVTDHSNSFDSADSANIQDGSVSSEWTEGHQLADQYTTDQFVSIFGYEMTWSNGLGHINTFNTNGFQSRTQKEYATYSTALQKYYETLKTVPDSISQFNHPGTTFGDFSDFSYYDEDIDKLITMIEVGNGEGAIGSSGYFPSYQYYQRALDKGWHVAPTNNQDNHKGLWGDANTARSVVMADSLTRENIYDAIRNYRLYASEDNDLSIYYTLDGYEMGSILSDGQTGDKVTLKAELSDPTDASVGRVQVITNGGLVLAETTVGSKEDTVTFEVDNNYSFYYLKITEPDGDIAVTAPVWVGEVEAAGINSMSTTEVLPVKGEALDINLDLYNNEASDLDIQSVEFKIGDRTIHSLSTPEELEQAGLTKVSSMGTADYTFSYTHDGIGSTEIQAVVKARLNGADKVYNSTLKLDYVTPDMVTKVVIDGSHYNDYVTGYYGANVGNFKAIAGKKNIRVEILTDESKAADTLKDCALFIVSAPAKKTGTANAGAYQPAHFSDDFIQAVKTYTDKGGTLIASGLADYQDTTSGQTHTEMNKLLAAIGATTRLNSDEAYDEENNGGQPYRLYLTNYNQDSPYLAGAVADQKYSAYSGCTVSLDQDAVAAGKAEALVTGFDTTYSIDTKDDAGNKVSGSSVVVEKGNVVALGHEALESGANVFVSGTVFISDFEVKAEMDNQFDLQYLNYTIINNILDKVTVEIPTTPIAQVRKAAMGEVFAIEGYITAARDNGNNAFFDAVCVQDDTAGITVFPWDDAAYGKVDLGTKVRVVGYVDAYQGEKELQVMSCKVLDTEEKHVYEAKKVSAAEAMDYDLNGGNLVQVTGKVTRITDKGTNGPDSVNQFYIDDGSGTEANVFIDGYILSGTNGINTIGTFVKEGSYVTAVGLVYSHPATGSDENEIVLRVRNCDEITVADNSGDSGDNGNNNGDNGNTNTPGDNGNSGNNGDSGNNGGSDNGGNSNGDNGKGSISNGSGNGTTTGYNQVTAVKTNDSANVAVWFILIIAMGAVIFVAAEKRYRHKA